MSAVYNITVSITFSVTPNGKPSDAWRTQLDSFFTHSLPHHTTHTTHTQTRTMSHLIIPFICVDITIMEQRTLAQLLRVVLVVVVLLELRLLDCHMLVLGCI